MNQFPIKYFLIVLINLVAFTLHAQVDRKETSKLQVNPQALNFIVMGDWGRNGEDHQKQVAAQMGKTASEASVDFIVATGDNFYPKGVISEFDPLWKYSYEDIYTAFSLQWDWYPVLGNHDYGSNPGAQVTYSKISRRWQMPARYYSKIFSLNNDTTQQVLFAFVDTCPLIKGYYNTGHAVHDQDSTAQKIWLEKLLATPSPNIKWKVVVGHHPMYTGGSRTENHDTRSIRRSLQPMLEKYKVDAYLAGHEHSLQHIEGPVKSVHHFISGAASERTPVRMLPASKFAASEYGFMLFSAMPDKILVQVINYKGGVLYTTSIVK